YAVLPPGYPVALGAGAGVIPGAPVHPALWLHSYLRLALPLPHRPRCVHGISPVDVLHPLRLRNCSASARSGTGSVPGWHYRPIADCQLPATRAVPWPHVPAALPLRPSDETFPDQVKVSLLPASPLVYSIVRETSDSGQSPE